MPTTRKTLRQRIGGLDYCGETVISTAMTGSSTAQIVDTKLANQDSTFVGAQVVITSGAASGDRRWVTQYTGSTGTITVDRAFSAAVASGDAYELHRVFSADDKDDAINNAILEAKARWPRIIEDASILMVANQYAYALGTLAVPLDPIALLDLVEWDPGLSGTGYPWNKFDDDEYYIRKSEVSGAVTLTLQLRRYPPYAGKAIRLTYRVRPSTFTNDTAALNPDEEGFAAYLCAKATAMLAEKRANLASEGASRNEHWSAMAARFQQKAEQIMAQDREPPVPGRVIFGVGDSQSRSWVWHGKDQGWFRS